MPNRLADQNSPYLLQHKDNPVDWYPWGEEALGRAKEENKPIFLSIGYAACHWCHVMEHESFEDPETAAVMNEHFINIKVDREERPDLDRIYMDAVVAITGQGGWPMSVFLTPDGKPFYGGTYFPPTQRYSMPSFQEVLSKVAALWADDQEEIIQSGEKLTQQLVARNLSPSPKGSQLDEETLDKAGFKLAQSYDWKNGGWGNAPKFPQPMPVLFLLQRASKGDKMALDMAAHALKAMAKGGMYDVIGGGFSRYSVDDEWLVPHFEKMLYDNAQLARAYLHAYKLTKEEDFRRVCEETLDFVLAEMTHPQGGFFSSIDADSEGEEGKYYVWKMDEIEEIIEEPDLIKIFNQAYGVTQEGNFEGYTVLQRTLDNDSLAEQFRISITEVQLQLDSARKKLYATREKRIRPATDDKVLVSWNAWMTIAFAEAARYLKRPDYLEAAQRNVGFLLSELYLDDRFLRSWRDGKAQHNAYLEDHASLILSLLAIYQSDHDANWFHQAGQITEEMIAHFSDPDGGFFDTRNDHEDLLLRPKETQDSATPSGNSLAAQALLQMAAYTGKGEWYDLAAQSLSGIQELLSAYPTGFGNWLNALSFALGEGKEIAIIGDLKNKDTQALIEVVWGELRTDFILAVSNDPPPFDGPPLLQDRPMIGMKPTAYVCQQFVCKQPTTSVEEFAKLLGE